MVLMNKSDNGVQVAHRVAQVPGADCFIDALLQHSSSTAGGGARLSPERPAYIQQPLHLFGSLDHHRTHWT